MQGKVTLTWPGHSDSSRLDVRNIKRHDNGTQYTCTMRAENGDTESTVFTLRVSCPPRKTFQSTLTMKEGRVSFQLAAYPVPDRFIFFRLRNQASEAGLDVSEQFAGACEQDPMTAFTVNCEVTRLGNLQHVTGMYKVEVYNYLNKLDVIFNMQAGPSTGDQGHFSVWIVYVAAAGCCLAVIVTFLVAIVIHTRRRRTATLPDNRIPSLYVECEEYADATPQQQSPLQPNHRPQMPAPASPSVQDNQPDPYEDTEGRHVGAFSVALQSQEVYKPRRQAYENDHYMHPALNAQ
ncbi:hypothetical protein V1264_024486 [Littorina saxatilis]|uniref:Ig-like domain-containing protein n=1 Tax=Littorina saxatilis TaxID=31220 RepID=A0AAN9AMP8_9CAEN